MVSEVRPPSPVELDGDPAGLPRERHRVPPREVRPDARVDPRAAVVERSSLDASLPALVGRLFGPATTVPLPLGRRATSMPTPTPFFILKRKTQRPYVCFTRRAMERRRRPTGHRIGRPCRCGSEARRALRRRATAPSASPCSTWARRRRASRCAASGGAGTVVEDPMGEVRRRCRLGGEEQCGEHGDDDCRRGDAARSGHVRDHRRDRGRAAASRRDLTRFLIPVYIYPGRPNARHRVGPGSCDRRYRILPRRAHHRVLVRDRRGDRPSPGRERMGCVGDGAPPGDAG